MVAPPSARRESTTLSSAPWQYGQRISATVPACAAPAPTAAPNPCLLRMCIRVTVRGGPATAPPPTPQGGTRAGPHPPPAPDPGVRRRRGPPAGLPAQRPGDRRRRWTLVDLHRPLASLGPGG